MILKASGVGEYPWNSFQCDDGLGFISFFFAPNILLIDYKLIGFLAIDS